MRQAAHAAHRMFTEAAWALRAGRPVHLVTIKSRARITSEIPRERQGWWADVAAGATLVLTDATAEDLARCSLNEHASRDPGDYWVECFERGALVSRIAAEHVTTLPAPVDPRDAERRRRAVQRKAEQHTDGGSA